MFGTCGGTRMVIWPTMSHTGPFPLAMRAVVVATRVFNASPA